MSDSSHTPRKRPQFSLWVLLFVIPTIAGVIFAVYSAFAAQDKRFRDLMAEEATLHEESVITELRKKNLEGIEASLAELIREKNSPEAVLFEIKTRPPSGYYITRDSIYFFLQASDQQLHDLVDLLVKEFQGSHPEIQTRILECLKRFPEYVVAERLKGIGGKVRAFVEPLQFDSNERISQLAVDTLHAFNSPSPLREED